MTRREAALAIAGAAALPLFSVAAQAAGTLTPAQARTIAAQAYVYGFPMVDLYRILWGYFADTGGPAFKAPMNALFNTANVYTPSDTTVQTPNSDTPYSFALFDLRAEPWVITLPPIESSRYYSVQLVDLYTYNSDYLGTRATGNGGGNFLIAGPGWSGTAPAGITKVIKVNTDFLLALYRTQLFDAADMANVKTIQAGYKIAPLSTFAGVAVPTPAPAIAWIAPLAPADERTSIGFFNILSWMLQYCPPFADEAKLRRQFERIGVVPGATFDPTSLTPAVRTALLAGMSDGQKQIDVSRAATTSSASDFGSRAQLGSNYLARAVGAQTGILGNTAAEAMYFFAVADQLKKPLDGAKGYALTFAPGALPPVRAFWSLTMYDLPQQLLVSNRLNRYLINSPMLPDLKKNADGSLTIYLSNASPGKDKESNWLPAPAGAFMCVLRCYYPEQAVLDGTWKMPPVVTAAP
ncbi:MAG TPA: DUF1254 domain-containing protein [Candidatus Acidoferrales bacterium]|nr:DUF1254 domain-containing protein [Candidatus Acidoferrales bacterium]